VPWALRYSTSDMAKDVLELCDHVGWTEKRQLNVIGVSMGGNDIRLSPENAEYQIC
jgi:pimeloyl-ACP methyl ester carboxylesterase